MSAIYHVKSISEAHRLLDFPPPKHPLISLFHHQETSGPDIGGAKITSDLYLIGMKDGVKGNVGYGRSSYDFQEGTLIFVQPGQVFAPGEVKVELDSKGWTLIFHPDLIRSYDLGKQISGYSFFSYAVNEALHLSQEEQAALSGIARTIEKEYSQNMDRHTEELIVANLDTLLKYCKRYYDRQFFTRSNLNKSILVRFESFLQDYCDSPTLQDKGLPSIEDCGHALNLSGNYLSDLLRIETGRSALEHIHEHILAKAKTTLLNSTKNVGEIAHELGFSYSQNFSRLFKAKTGMSPKAFRAGGD